MYNISIQKGKLEQAISILEELDIDMWMTVGRETSMNNDPVLPIIAGVDFTALAALIVTKTGDTIALVGHNDTEGVAQTGLYKKVVGYDTSFKEEIIKLLDSINPKNIALNYSTDNVAADGLSHGLYMIITDILNSNGYEGKIISADDIISKLRGRKSIEEQDRVIKAIETAEKIFIDARSFIKAGVTEIDIFNYFHDRMKYYSVEPSWQASQCPGVMVGPNTAIGHNGPTEIVAERGFVMNIDFGVLENEYCSDLQRIYYVLEDGETKACDEVQRAFDTIQEGIRRAVAFMKPGVTGSEVDSVAREYIVSQGYPEWNYALGHQVGRLAHDGGIILATNRWSRYLPKLVNSPVEEGMIFTFEPGIATSRGYVGQEEMAIVTSNGATFLSKQQEGIYLV